ncbi:high light inducible protein [Prochlorococcus marinus]|uniref:High light inducible protein n=1 Tax=Prochlorococcus marinus XMU1408 TaxID=2213228 RepID=A0A318R301_PROMR|nr:high light inducible protein [Prochlorococcus marinus]MBW3042057.1 high light inducible protein [Prochlorococcus marinus str. XMU1408]PYE03175.1 high light inducible protein [Prochlorococcus marinus XMU1408]
MKKQTKQAVRVEEGKIIAERLNGYAAFIGCWALIGAYLTTGQIIPGIV